MQIVSVPAEAMVDPALNLTSIVERHASDTSNPVLYRWQMSPGNWQDIHAHQFHDMVVSVAKGLIAHGVKPGDRIGIMSRTRFEWALIDFCYLVCRSHIGTYLRDERTRTSCLGLIAF